MEDEKTNPQKLEKLKAELEPDAKVGKYSNFVQIQHTPLDFRMDFAQMVPEDKKYYITNRVFMSPQHAKLFSNALLDNIRKFENQFGEIRTGVERGPLPSGEIH